MTIKYYSILYKLSIEGFYLNNISNRNCLLFLHDVNLFNPGDIIKEGSQVERNNCWLYLDIFWHISTSMRDVFLLLDKI